MLSSRQSLCTSDGGPAAGTLLEPIDHGVRRRHVLRLGALPAAGPALHLPGEESVGLAEVLEADGGVVDGMEIGERVDQYLRQLAGLLGIAPAAEAFRHLAVPPPRGGAPTGERDADQRAPRVHVGAGAGGSRETAPTARGTHVPCRARPPVVAVRRPAQHVLGSGIAQQIGQVRVIA
jgi:hypothetical protein